MVQHVLSTKPSLSYFGNSTWIRTFYLVLPWYSERVKGITMIVPELLSSSWVSGAWRR